MEDQQKVKPKIPTPPPQLRKEARKIYRELYSILLAEDRGSDKFRHQVAISANALYFYQIAVDSITITKDMSTNNIGIAIRTLNSASMEWTRAGRALLLTPEAELKLSLDSTGVDGQPPPTMADMIGEILGAKSKNDNYGTKNPQPIKKLEKMAKNKKKSDG